jgi:(S)-2-hydroxyglutarate dehydrogenase
VTPLQAGDISLRSPRGELEAGFAVFCAGEQADRLAVMCGAPPDSRVVPFRGAYLRLRPERRELVRGLIYPVPDPRLPFLGVHLTRTTGGDVLVGPTALLAAEGMRRSLTWPGSWRMAARHWRAGVAEIGMAASRRRFADAARRYVPDLSASDMQPAFSGRRAQAIGRDGKLVDDFVVHRTERALHVRNAPSPAATSSLALARLIADKAEPGLD